MHNLLNLYPKSPLPPPTPFATVKSYRKGEHVSCDPKHSISLIRCPDTGAIFMPLKSGTDLPEPTLSGDNTGSWILLAHPGRIPKPLDETLLETFIKQAFEERIKELHTEWMDKNFNGMLRQFEQMPTTLETLDS